MDLLKSRINLFLCVIYYKENIIQLNYVVPVKKNWKWCLAVTGVKVICALE